MEIEGKSLVDDKAMGNWISLVSPSMDFKGSSYTGGEIQSFLPQETPQKAKGMAKPMAGAWEGLSHILGAVFLMTFTWHFCIYSFCPSDIRE